MSDDTVANLYEAIPTGAIEQFLARTDGMTSLDEAKFLYELATHVTDGCIVEVGAYRGRSTVALGRGSLDGHRVPVFVIEPHQKFSGVLGGQFGPADAGAFYQAILESGCYHVVRLVSLSSEQVVSAWGLPVTLLWIDGDHRYEAVKRDFDCWRAHLANGATVVFDDILEPCTGPKQLISEILATGEFSRTSEFGKIAVLKLNPRSEEVRGQNWLRRIWRR